MHRDFFMTLKNEFFSLQNVFKKAFYAVIGGLFAVVFFSCSSPLTSATYSSLSYSKSDGVLIQVSYPATNGRFIAPSTVNLSDIKKFVVTGENYDGDVFSQQVTVDSTGKGTITGLSKSYWQFVLHAYSDTAGTKEVLHGFSSVDTTYETNVSFVLTSIDLDGKGSLNVTASFDDPEGFANVNLIRVYLCSCITQNLDSAVISREITDSAELALFETSGYEISGTTINPGNYSLIIKLYNNSIGSTQLLGTCSDIVDIEPARTTTGSISISSTILQKKPEKPDNFKVYRVDSSVDSNFYTAVLRWEDKAVNEEYYVIKVYESASSDIAKGTNILTIDKTNYSTISVANNGVGYYSGNLLYGSEEYALKLRTGKLYEFEIYAMNTFGRSDVVSRKASSDIENDITYGDMTGFGASSSSPYLHVNTFEIKYHLGGGIYKTEADEYTTAQNMPVYEIWKNTPISLISPVAITDTTDMSNQAGYPVLYFDTPYQAWSSWKDINGTPVTQVSSFENVTVYAQYNLISTPTIELDASTVSLFYGASAAESKPGSGTSAVNVMNLTAGTYITVAVNADAASNANFTDYDFYINGSKQITIAASSVQSVGGTNYVMYTFQIPFKGTYTAQVAGINNGTSYYCSEFNFGSNN